jgi:class 3 adenylate cyclase
MSNYLRFFWPFNIKYTDISACGIYRELRGISLAAVVWPILVGTFLFYYGLSLTAYQQLLGLTMIVPGGAIVLLIVGNYLLQRDFRPIKLFLDTPPEQIDTRIASEALIQARNFQLLSARRVLLYQAPAFALGFSLMTFIANIFMGLGLELWQFLIALMVAFMVGIGHAIFEFYAVAKLMVQVITLAHDQCGNLTHEQQQRVIRVDTKRKLLFVSGLIVMTPMIILGTTLLIRIRHELHQAALIEHLDMIMPGMIGWVFLIMTVGSIMSLLIFLRMASDTSDSLLELSNAMKKVEEGSLDVSLLEKTSDEYAGIYRRFNRMVKELVERERLRDAFGRYVSKELADDVMQHGVCLGGKEVQASILFADIRDFTAMSAKMSAEEVVSLLNEYFSAVEPAIKEQGGWINKFGGDSLLAVFGVLTPQPDHINHAVQAALKMRDALHKFNMGQQKDGKRPLRIGVGIHCGNMVAGSVGSHDRMEFTVIGDAVNMASRIEGLNKKWGTDILISEDVAKATKRVIALESMPKTRVHGISKPIQVFAIK